MIREKLIGLRERRALLVARAEHQRAAVAGFVAQAESATLWFDRGRALLTKLKAHPVWIAAGVALLVALRPRKAFKWLATGFSMWRGWLKLQATLERFAPAQPPASNLY